MESQNACLTVFEKHTRSQSQSRRLTFPREGFSAKSI